jgi:cytochrome c peroxidase
MGLQILKPLLAALLLAGAAAAELPAGSVIDPPATSFPSQRLRSEIAGGEQSWLVALGNTAFSSPLLYGETARQAGLSCNSCHVNGHLNQAFFIPGHSARPAGLDPTGPLFNPAANDRVMNHTDIPSLRGIRSLGPFGRDGRISSLREFARHVIVDEFAGPEPAPLLLDALVAYMNEFEFLPNPRLGPLGQLRNPSTEERRGESLFRAPRRGMGGMSCADCHRPDSAFTDSRPHDVGTGGLFRTPTLLNTNSSAPYGHDGRWADYPAVVAHFDTSFGLSLTAADRRALVAYLRAVGDAEEAEEPATFRREMAELASYVGVLDGTLERRDAVLTRFVAETVVSEMQRLRRAFPDGDARRQANRPDRNKAEPLSYDALCAGLLDVARLADAGDFRAAVARLDAYHETAERMVANYPRPNRRP